MKGTSRASLNLKSSICTDNPTGSDTYDFNSEPTQIVQNTGIERNGGVSTIYEQETTFATAGANSIITKSGDLLQVDSSHNVRLNNSVIGNVGPCSVYRRGVLPGAYLDAAWTTTGTLVAIKLANKVITVDEYDPATASVINTRDITFARMPAKPFLYVALVKYVDMTYVANQEFIIQIVDSTTYILKESGTSVTNTETSAINSAWRFAAGKYLLWNQGTPSVTQQCWIGDVGDYYNLAISQSVNVKWVVIDRYVGTSYSRAVLTYNTPTKNAANMFTGYAVVGYNGLGVYSATQTYFGVALGAVTATVKNPISGPGYVECTYIRSDTAPAVNFYVAPDFEHGGPDPGWLSSDVFTGTFPKINAYGKLTDIHVAGANSTFLTSVRIGMVNDEPAYISVAPITSGKTTWDHIGVPITNVGEFDPTFMLHVVDDNSTYTRIVYRYNRQLYYVDIRSGQAHEIYKISDRVYMINCLSAFNVVDTEKGSLELGVNDYNGRFIMRNSGSGTDGQWVAKIVGDYSNSIDTGAKFAQTSGSSTSIYEFPGVELPTFIDRYVKYQIDVYLADVYTFSISGYSYTVYNPFTDYDLTSSLYVADTRLPIAMGSTFGDKVAWSDVSTFFLGVGVAGVPDIDYDYAGYELGNDISGTFESLYLYGQRYIFDGLNVYLTSFSGSLYQTKYFVCPATGLQFIAVSPNLAYFLSTFDNSIYTFDGGRSVQKSKRMNDLRNSSGGIETIINGVYNVRDDALLLQTFNTFVWVRDGIVTQNNKKATQTSLTLYDTAQGIQIANNTLKWTYDFATRGTTTTTGGTAVTTVAPFTWQSAYHSLKGNELSIAHNWVVTFYHPEGLSPVPITLRCHAFDQDTYTLQRADLTINPSDWDGLGFYRARIQPKNRRALASSLQIDTTQNIIITDVSVEYADETQAVIAGQRSR